MSKIHGTDVDLLAQLPNSPDREKRAAEAGRLAELLGGFESEDPAVAALVARVQEQARFVGSPAAEVDSQGEAEVVSEQDEDSGSDTSGDDIEASAAQELSPESMRTLATLRGNFESREPQLRTSIEWDEVENKLRKSPEKLTILSRLIARGGEPTVTAKLPNGSFRFDELSEESPQGHRDVDYDRAVQIATKLGAVLMEPDVYDSFRGKMQLDFHTWSWLRTPEEVRNTGDAFAGSRGISCQYDAYGHHPDLGLRCSLEV